MNRTVKFGLVAMAVLCVVAALVAYKHRRQVHSLLHRMKQALVGHSVMSGGAPAPVGSLEMAGRKYTDVLGFPPYYLPVPQINSVLFVTRLNSGGTNLFHVVNLKTGQDEEIPTIADFGRNIGAAGNDFRDYIERAQPGEVVVATETMVGRRTKSVYHLDLPAGLVNTREVFYYDQNGHTTNVYEGPGF